MSGYFKTTVTLIVVATIGLLFGLMPTLISVSPVEAGTQLHPEIVSFEVAEDGTRFTPDEAPVFEEDGMPAFGAAFVTQGYIYPEGTLTCDDEGNCDGVLSDGSPEFPDLVLGEWTCWGYHVSDGAHTESGPLVVTNQMYSFGEPGTEMLTTTGYEMVDLNAPFSRAVTGGTGIYANVTGVQEQELLGLNNADEPTFGMTIRVSFELDDVAIESESMDADTE